MKKFKLSSLLALSIVASTCLASVQPVLAAGAELPKDFDANTKVESKMTIYDIVKRYSRYQGESVSHSYSEKQSNGSTYYYRGTLEYIGRDGLLGDYMYLGDKRDFELYKVVTSDGTIITPQYLNN